MASMNSYDSFPTVIWDEEGIFIGKSTMYNWENEHPEWKEAKEIAFAKRLSFLEKRLTIKVSGQEVKFVYVVYCFTLPRG